MATWIQKPYLFWYFDLVLSLVLLSFCCLSKCFSAYFALFAPRAVLYVCCSVSEFFSWYNNIIIYKVSAQLLYSAFFPLFFREDWHNMEENRRGCDMIDICCQYEVQNPWVLLTGVNRTKYSFQLQKYFIAAAHQIILTFETTIVSPKLCITITVSPLIRSPN